MPRSSEAKKLCRELDNELEAAGAQGGHTLVWSAQETVIIGLISAQIDRKVELLETYEGSDDPKVKVKLSGELRLLEQSIGRLLKQIRTDVPKAESQRTTAARRAVQTRWDRQGA